MKLGKIMKSFAELLLIANIKSHIFALNIVIDNE